MKKFCSKHGTSQKLILICAIFFIFSPKHITYATEKGWSVSVFDCVLTGDGIAETAIMISDFDPDYNMLAIAIGKDIMKINNDIKIQAEGQFIKHIGDQKHMEYNFLFVGRWLTFSWDKTLDTSFAAGEGISYASEVPKIEQQHHENATQLLNYLMFEFAFAKPNQPQWELFIRLHHRSGAYGLYSNVHGASNALGMGVRYNF